MPIQPLLRVSYSAKDAWAALKTMIPSMAFGFNVNTHCGNFAVHDEEAQAMATILAEIINRRLAAGRVYRKKTPVVRVADDEA